MEEKKTKILVPTIVAVATLIVLVVGATYAYFTVGATNNFETRTIEASADSVGVVTLTSNENNLYLNMPAHLMMKDAIPEGATEIVYSAVTDPEGLPTRIDPNYTVAEFTVSGGGTYECSVDYDLTISGTMFENLKTIESESESEDDLPYEVYLSLYSSGSADYDSSYELIYEMPWGAVVNGETLSCGTNGDSCSDTINFKIGDLSENSLQLFLGLQLVNKRSVDQTAIAGTSMTVEFDITDFSCTAINSI